MMRRNHSVWFTVYLLEKTVSQLVQEQKDHQVNYKEWALRMCIPLYFTTVKQGRCLKPFHITTFTFTRSPNSLVKCLKITFFPKPSKAVIRSPYNYFQASMFMFMSNYQISRCMSNKYMITWQICSIAYVPSTDKISHLPMQQNCSPCPD